MVAKAKSKEQKPLFPGEEQFFPGTDGTQLVDREAELKRQIEAQQKMLGKITTSSRFISFKGGNIIIDKKPIPGAKTEVVVLAFLAERTYFPGRFDPDERQSPTCYAYAIGEEMVPHAEAKDPQAVNCEDCEWNRWNTAEVGRGKKCRESIRIALMPYTNDMSKGDVWHARIPITSVSAFKEFAESVLGYGRSLHSVVAKLMVVPDDKTFFKVLWEVKQEVPEKLIPMLAAKALSAQNAITFPYPDFDEEEKKKPSAKVEAKLTKRRK